MRRTILFREASVDWSYIPSINELEENIRIQALVASGVLGRGFAPSDIELVPAVSFKPTIRLKERDYFEHSSSDLNEIRRTYSESGFDTNVILQDPIGHRGPTVACPIGFPSNLHKRYDELRRFNRWICRVHVDIAHRPRTKKLISVPHIEPDPAFHTLDHIWDTFICKHVVRGRPAVDILKSLLVR